MLGLLWRLLESAFEFVFTALLQHLSRWAGSHLCSWREVGTDSKSEGGGIAFVLIWLSKLQRQVVRISVFVLLCFVCFLTSALHSQCSTILMLGSMTCAFECKKSISLLLGILHRFWKFTVSLCSCPRLWAKRYLPKSVANSTYKQLSIIAPHLR